MKFICFDCKPEINLSGRRVYSSKICSECKKKTTCIKVKS